MTPLHYAARYDRVEVAKALLEKGAATEATDKVRNGGGPTTPKSHLSLSRARARTATAASCCNQCGAVAAAVSRIGRTEGEAVLSAAIHHTRLTARCRL